MFGQVSPRRARARWLSAAPLLNRLRVVACLSSAARPPAAVDTDHSTMSAHSLPFPSLTSSGMLPFVPSPRVTETCATEQNRETLGEEQQRFSHRKWAFLFGLIATTCAVADMSRTTLAPFLPAAAADRNVSSVATGVIFAAPAGAVVLVTPLAPRLVHCMGERLAIACSLFVFGLTMLSFAWVQRLPAVGHSFTIAAIGLRALQGVACTAMDTAAGSFVMRTAPTGRESDAIGWLEAARGFGSLLGPPVGGLLFQMAPMPVGWELPFLVPGAVAMLLLVPVAIYVPRIPTDSSTAQQLAAPVGVAQLFFAVPEAMAMAMLIVTSIVAVSFLQPTLAVYTSATFNLSSGLCGLLFGGLTLAYIVTSVGSGSIASRLGDANQVVFGVLTFALGYMLLGGAPFIGGSEYGTMRFTPTIASVAIGMCLVGTAGGLCFVPGNALAISGARAAGYSLDQIAAALTAGMNMAFAAGNVSPPGLEPDSPFTSLPDSIPPFRGRPYQVAGPLLGGLAVSHFGFRWSCTGLGSSLVIVCVAIAPLLYYRRCFRRAKTSSGIVGVADHERSAALLDHPQASLEPAALSAHQESDGR